jgi:hypothetical protein
MNKAAASFLLFIISAIGYGQPVKLAPPLLKYQSVFFKDSAIVEMLFAEKNTEIHFHLASILPGESDEVYEKPIVLKNRMSNISAITTGKGFLSSRPATATFIKNGLPFSVIKQTTPNERFAADGLTTLNDQKGGNTNLNAGTWLGYQADSVTIELQLAKQEQLSSILIHVLRDNESWIFLPEQISVFSFDEKEKEFLPVAVHSSPSTHTSKDVSCIPVVIIFPEKITTKKIKVILKPVQSIPESHPGKGKPGWLFIDEIKLY